MKVVAFDVLISVKKQIGMPTGLSSCNLNRSVRIQSISLPSGRADIESKESKRFAQPDPKCGAEDAVSYSPDLAADVACSFAGIFLCGEENEFHRAERISK